MINEKNPGIYVAFPMTAKLKPIYRGYKTQVNNRHTKVGIADKSLASRRGAYQTTFGGEVEFIPISDEVPAEQLKALEQVILAEVRERYRRVGRAKEWFDTDNRNAIIAIVRSVLKRLLSNKSLELTR